jgi:hypothetical protein
MRSVDVSEWEPAGEEYLGTKPKQWLRAPTGELWLWKESTSNPDRRGRTYRRGDDWSEAVAAQVASKLGVPVARVELASHRDRFGIISRKVLGDDEELIHGNELPASITGSRRDGRDRSGYSLEAVYRVLEGTAGPIAGADIEAAFDWFVGYLVLDAVIGNTDRHQDK